MYKINPEDLASLTAHEILYGTERFLPAMIDIPKEFKANIYIAITNAMYVGDPIPKGEVQIKAEYLPYAEFINKFLNAHLKSIQADYDHKIIGVAFMMNTMMHITAILT